jgi:hypothetical protein
MKANMTPQAVSGPIGGAHHCIGTAQSVIDIVFHHLHGRCVSHGGQLSHLELAAAKADLVRGFIGTTSFFENIHNQCIMARGQTADRMFAPGEILSSLLSLGGSKATERVYSIQLSFLADNWLDVFYQGFSIFIQKHVSANSELRLSRAYAKSACNFRQALSVRNLLAEEDIQNELLNCIAQFKNPEACNQMTALATDEINNHIALNSWKVYRHVSKITREQMSEFLRIFPSEMLAFLEPFRSGAAPRVVDGRAGF